MFSKILSKRNSLKLLKTVNDYPKTTFGIFCGVLFNINLMLLRDKNLDKDLLETILLIA